MASCDVLIIGGGPAGSACAWRLVARLVPDAVKAPVAGQLLRVPAFVKRVVIDDWFLHARQPALF